MARQRLVGSFAFASFLSIAAVLMSPSSARAHCDTLDGPVVKDARQALAKGDVSSVLKWVTPRSEPEIKAAFQKTLKAREAGGEAKDVAETWFFETLVRVHRAGEGAPFTGLKPAGSDLPHMVVAADRALEGAVAPGELADHLSSAIAAGLRSRFAAALEKQKRASTSIEAGREFVAAYVEYIHYVETLAKLAAEGAGHSEGGATER